MVLKSNQEYSFSTSSIIPVRVRKAQISDAKQLSELILENAEELVRPHYSEEQWNIFIKYYSEEVVAEKIGRQVVFIAEKEGLIVGTVALEDDFVVGVYTRLQNVGQGIGKLLMAHLENYAKDSGVTQLQLAASPTGLAFYYKNGWEKVKEFIIEYYGVGFEETLMIKNLH